MGDYPQPIDDSIERKHAQNINIAKQLAILLSSIEQGEIPEDLGNDIAALDAGTLEIVDQQNNLNGVDNLYYLAEKLSPDDKRPKAILLLAELKKASNPSDINKLAEELAKLAAR